MLTTHLCTTDLGWLSYCQGAHDCWHLSCTAVMCKFKGLANFPFDDLECGVDFGGWLTSGAQQGLQLWGDGFEYSTAEETSGTSYQEFAIQKIQASISIFQYDTDGEDELWPLIHYQITLKRADNFYIHVLVWPGLLITITSFSVFFMTIDSGERLGYGITTVLAMEVMKVVIDSLVPTCGEILWSDLFTFVNEWACFFALFESCVVIFLSHYDKPTIFPPWLSKLFNYGAGPAEAAGDGLTTTMSMAKAFYRNLNGPFGHMRRSYSNLNLAASPPPSPPNSVASEVRAPSDARRTVLPATKFMPPQIPGKVSPSRLERSSEASQMHGMRSAASLVPEGSSFFIKTESDANATEDPRPRAHRHRSKHVSRSASTEGLTSELSRLQHRLDALESKLEQGLQVDTDATDGNLPEPPKSSTGPGNFACAPPTADPVAPIDETLLTTGDASLNKPHASASKWLRSQMIENESDEPMAIPAEVAIPPGNARRLAIGAPARRHSIPFADLNAVEEDVVERDRTGKLRAVRKLDEADAEKLIYFEGLFFELDCQTTGYVDHQTMETVLSYLRFDLSCAEIRVRVAQADQQSCGGASSNGQLNKFTAESADGMLVRWEFMELCIDLLWGQPIPTLQAAFKVYRAASKFERDERLLYWKITAKSIDETCRVLVPFIYFSLIVLIYQVRLGDQKYAYDEDNPAIVEKTSQDACLPPRSIGDNGVCTYKGEQYQGIYSWSMSGAGVVRSLFLPSLFLLGYLTYTVLARTAQRKGLLPPTRSDIARSNAEALHSARAQQGPPSP